MKKILIVLGLFAVLSFCFTGCRTVTEYVEVPVTHTVYVKSTDSVYLHDSIWTYVENKNETVKITQVKWKLKEVFKTDTLRQRDTISVPVPVEKVVEVNKLYFWQKALMFLGGLLVAAALIILMYKFIKWKFCK